MDKEFFKTYPRAVVGYISEDCLDKYLKTRIENSMIIPHENLEKGIKEINNKGISIGWGWNKLGKPLDKFYSLLEGGATIGGYYNNSEDHILKSKGIVVVSQPSEKLESLIKELGLPPFDIKKVNFYRTELTSDF